MWFDGPVATAVAKAKSEECPLIVFVCGNDEKSKTAESCWKSATTKNIVMSANCVALKLIDGSESAKQFAQIYPTVCIPISFFIMPNGGVPLEIIVDHEPLESFQLKLTNALKAFQTKISNGKQPERSAAVAEGDVSNQETTPTSPELADRVQRARSLIKERQELTAAMTEEAARQAEIKRRQQGRDMAAAQERVKEAEAKQIVEERKNAKKKDKEYLQKLREQIAADRAEKHSNYETGKAVQQQEKDESLAAKRAETERLRQEEVARRNENALLQFRLPDGQSLRNQFQSQDTFAKAEEWIQCQCDQSLMPFLLVQMMPRREFNDADKQKTLAQLGLVPSAVLMVLPRATLVREPSLSTSGVFSGFVSMVMAPVRYVYNIIYVFIFGTPRPRAVAGTAKPSASSSQPQQRPTGGRRVAGLHNRENSDDEDQARWNGNSTQQL